MINIQFQCSIELPDVQEYDATKADQGTGVGNTIIINY